MTLGGLKGHHAASGKDKESFSAMSWLQQWAIWLQTKPSRFCFLAICGLVETEQWKQLLASSVTRAGGSFGDRGLAWSFVGLCREVSGGRFRKGGGHFADGPHRRSRGWRDGLRGDGTRCDQSCWCWWKKRWRDMIQKNLTAFAADATSVEWRTESGVRCVTPLITQTVDNFGHITIYLGRTHHAQVPGIERCTWKKKRSTNFFTSWKMEVWKLFSTTE